MKTISDFGFRNAGIKRHFKMRKKSSFKFQSTIQNRKSPMVGGFTLIEIMVVVVIIGLLVAIVSTRIMVQYEKAKVTQTRIQIRNLEQALKLFKLDCGFYPSTEQGLKALVEKPTVGKIPTSYDEGGYLEKGKVPLDAWVNPFIYLSPGLYGEFDIISLGRDGKEGGEGFDEDIYSWDIE